MDSLDADPTDRELVDIWQQALEAVAHLADGIDDDGWSAPTPCPGWAVADVVAHLVDIEQVLEGGVRPDHQPDWDRLPHVSSDFGRFAEVGVDRRRGATRAAVIAELRDAIEVRRAQLDATPDGAEVIGPLGNPTSLQRLLRMRTFDTWVHEQDIRAAIGVDGDWATPPARIAFQQMTRSLPLVWSRSAKAPSGATVHVRVTGPDLTGDVYADVDASGRGVACPTVAQPTVDLVLSWPDFMRLCAGRVPIDDPALLDRLQLTGDSALGTALLAALAITP